MYLRGNHMEEKVKRDKFNLADALFLLLFALCIVLDIVTQKHVPFLILAIIFGLIEGLIEFIRSRHKNKKFEDI